MTQTIEATATTKVINRLRDLKETARDMFMIDPRNIIIDDGMNPRDYTLPENRAHLDALKESIKENGTLIPLTVRFDAKRKAAVLVDGECRLRANLELIADGVEIKAVPTIGADVTSEKDILLRAVISNQGKPLSDLELGGAFKRMYNFGWSEQDIAKKTGKSATYVKRCIELTNAPEEVKEMVANGEITPALAISEVRENGIGAIDLLRAAIEKRTDANKPATREQVKKVTQINLAPTAKKLFEDDIMHDLLNTDCPYLSVSREVMVRLALMLGLITEADMEAAA
jgi:ParB/RepB/Spo0J family partition protein